MQLCCTQTTEADEELPLDDSDDDEEEQNDKTDTINDKDNKEDEDSDEGASLYPDTNIGVKVVSGK